MPPAGPSAGPSDSRERSERCIKCGARPTRRPLRNLTLGALTTSSDPSFAAQLGRPAAEYAAFRKGWRARQTGREPSASRLIVPWLPAGMDLEQMVLSADALPPGEMAG